MNLIHVSIEKLEELPQHESIRNKRRNHWYIENKYPNSFGPRNPYFTADKIIENNIGKSYNKAFSYFCKNTKIEDRHAFYNNFIYFGKWRYSNYKIDDEGNIQDNCNKKLSKSVIFKSLDFKEKLIHKITGHDKEMFVPFEIITGYSKYTYKERVYEGNKFMRSTYPIYIEVHKPIKKQIGWKYIGNWNTKPLHKQYFATHEDFVLKTISGIKKEFSSVKDPEYIRLMEEDRKRKRKSDRIKSKTSIKDWDFILKQSKFILHLYDLKSEEIKEKLKQEFKQENEIKILSHGFDLKTSFRTSRKFEK